MADPLRETRTMVLCALPYPPLPVKVGKLQADAMIIEREEVTTLHSLLAVCMNDSVNKNNKEANDIRRDKQIQVLKEFLHDLATEGMELSGEKLYNFYCKHSYKHLSTYFDSPPAIMFEPYSYMTIGDKSHNKLVEYCAAQGVLYEEPGAESQAERFKKLSQAQLLLLCRLRMGQSMPISAE